MIGHVIQQLVVKEEVLKLILYFAAEVVGRSCEQNY